MDAGYVWPAASDDMKSVGMTPVVIENGYRKRPLTAEQKVNNRRKSKSAVLHRAYLRFHGRVDGRTGGEANRPREDEGQRSEDLSCVQRIPVYADPEIPW